MHRVLAFAAVMSATIALAACGAAASPSPSASAAATTGASPSAAATDAPPTASDDASGSAGATDDAGASPSFAMPSVSLPSGAQDLEALLPDEICGTEALKFSFGGDQFEQQADAEMQGVLDELGAQPSDVSMAVAGSASAQGDTCNAAILRIAGANTDELRTAFISATEEEGDTVEEQQIGGRTVYAVGSDGETQHVYFVEDPIVFLAAPEAELEALLAELP